MKKIVFALACLVIGSAAIAAEPNTTVPAEKKATVRTTNKSGIKVGPVKKQESKFRIQKSFTMFDSCGQQITVWVSAPNGTSWDVMYQVAIDHVIGCLNDQNCYQQ